MISVFSGSNRFSLSLSLFVLLALFAPSQLPSSAEQGWAGNLLIRFNPVTAGEHFVGRIVVNGHSWSEDISWLVSPVLAAVVFAVAGAARRPGGSCRSGAVSPDDAQPSSCAGAARRRRDGARAGRRSRTPPPARPGSPRRVDRTRISTELGHTFVFRSTIANDGRRRRTG